MRSRNINKFILDLNNTKTKHSIGVFLPLMQLAVDRNVNVLINCDTKLLTKVPSKNKKMFLSFIDRHTETNVIVILSQKATGRKSTLKCVSYVESTVTCSVL